MNAYPALVISLSLALLLAVSAMHQLRAAGQWPQMIANYRLLPASLVRPVALSLPLIELACALALLVPRTCPAGALATALLLASFALAMHVNIRRGRTALDCGCAGARPGQGIAGWMVARNLLLAGLALLLLSPAPERTLSMLEIVAAVGTVATLALLYPVAGTAWAPVRQGRS